MVANSPQMTRIGLIYTNRPSECYTLMSDREHQIEQVCNHLFGGANINEIYLHIQNNPKRLFRHKNTPIQSASGMPREDMALSSGRPRREFPVLSGRSSGGPRCSLATKMKNKSGVSKSAKATISKHPENKYVTLHSVSQGKEKACLPQYIM